MNLVAYGSSDEADSDHEPAKASSSSKAKLSSKPAFQKLVDSSNPNKIKINLGDANVETTTEDKSDEPPAKKAKLGGGGFQDFMSSLPPPKRSTNAPGAGSKGLKRGVSLKTGAAPAFTRESVTASEEEVKPDTQLVGERTPDVRDHELKDDSPVGKGSMPALPAKKATIFRPLSVARKSQKKKPANAPIESSRSAMRTESSSSGVEASSKPTLFSSMESTAHLDDDQPMSQAKAPYQTMLYQSVVEPSRSGVEESDEAVQSPTSQGTPSTEANQNESLDVIASSLNLTSSQRRQLLGRHAGKSSAQAITVTNFNTDAEYAANEALRQSGEAVQHHALRPIAGGGKHSLKQLVSSAVGQKDALEEKFAEGNRNRKEGANRYGW